MTLVKDTLNFEDVTPRPTKKDSSLVISDMSDSRILFFWMRRRKTGLWIFSSLFQTSIIVGHCWNKIGFWPLPTLF